MFTGVITAMVLTFGAVSLGLLDYSQVWVNPTYLWSGILGGLIMGVGFIIGGFCPTTSLASASTGKIDGMMFMLGGFVGAFLFGETERFFTDWYNNAGYFGRLTLMDVFGLPTGIVVLMVVLMALFMFWGSEQLERIIGKKDMSREPKLRLYGAGVVVLLALAIVFIGMPSTEQKYEKATILRTVPQLQADGTVKDVQVKYTAEEALKQRIVQITPAELFKARYDQGLILTMLDVRPEADYNLFHLRGALNIPAEKLKSRIPELLATSAPNAVYVVMGNDEGLATQSWRLLTAEGVPNVYILEGGLNHWITVFGHTDPEIQPVSTAPEETLRFKFPAALGDRYECSDPDPIENEHIEFVPKIQLQIKRDKSSGGCG
jgi:rhodanese-related sulfurtransferase